MFRFMEPGVRASNRSNTARAFPSASHSGVTTLTVPVVGARNGSARARRTRTARSRIAQPNPKRR